MAPVVFLVLRRCSGAVACGTSLTGQRDQDRDVETIEAARQLREQPGRPVGRCLSTLYYAGQLDPGQGEDSNFARRAGDPACPHECQHFRRDR